ncbi:MAG: hypothetical protein ABSA86_02180 [Oryzomonas sp.]
MSYELTEKEKKKIRYETYCASFTDAWVNTNIEKDKSLLTISSGAIALLVTLLTSFKVSSKYILYYYFAALFYFMVTIILIIIVLGKNADFVELLLDDRENGKNGIWLKNLLHNLDRTIIYCFFAGILTTIIIAAQVGINKLNEETKTMSDKKDLPVKDQAIKPPRSLEKGGGTIKPTK